MATYVTSEVVVTCRSGRGFNIRSTSIVALAGCSLIQVYQG